RSWCVGCPTSVSPPGRDRSGSRRRSCAGSRACPSRSDADCIRRREKGWSDPMSDLRQRLLPPFLIFAGLICLGAYPLHVLWPSGWEWGMEGRHYLHMILVVYATLGIFLIRAAKDPGAHRSLLLFTAWSSAAHGLLMAGQAVALGGHGPVVGGGGGPAGVGGRTGGSDATRDVAEVTQPAPVSP